MKRGFFFAGPSGGHIFPAQAVAESFHEKRNDYELFLFTCRRARFFCKTFEAGLFTRVIELPEFGLPTGFKLRHLIYLWNIPCAFIVAFYYYVKYRPVFCFGAGSFVSFLGVWLAKKFGIPVLIHEQNATAGKATASSAAYADRIALTFPTTSLGDKRLEGFWTGLPIRRSLWEAAGRGRAGKVNGEAFHLLVMGGSQGAFAINRLLVEIFESWPLEKRSKIAVKHITGRQDAEYLRGRYQALKMDAQVFSFVAEMQNLYNWADGCLMRAGANSLWEAFFFGASILAIPYPFAGSHQVSNAKAFQEMGTAVYHEQNDALPVAIETWLEDKVSEKARGVLLKNKNRPEINPSAKIADQIIELSEMCAS